MDWRGKMMARMAENILKIRLYMMVGTSVSKMRVSTTSVEGITVINKIFNMSLNTYAMRGSANAMDSLHL